MDEEEVALCDADGHQSNGTLRRETLTAQGAHRLTINIRGREPVSADSSDYFEAMQLLRLQLEAIGLRLCCAGARRDTWASGVQRDMGQGLNCYILTLPRSARRPDQIGIFEPAACELIGTVTEQRAYFDTWLASTREK
ncbi:MAG: hypothetical protein JF887_07860 [Candidatus Dormibacteraeota bacterium]|uniref:Uncharacterized protein n=1 Tax=Candidatus Amunia macphersoniae TaxID=3127014 RepID=A0A934KM28_9BACT|nr:hypothetical protein [Candidatus Dormibacteraeota bacterium]